ncbi:MAG: phosphoadenosine phosphosulfate reductase family protein [Oscillospiraceae bacterium]|nr:phosphoadenosine phosphosulfate reductase family protein [Oscillospiraceae bacterium]
MRYNIQAKRCKICIMPETPGHVELDENGVCNLCRAFRQTEMQQETFESFSPEKKLAILQKKVDRYKNKGEYDCAVAVSGGKDSIMTLYIAVKVLGLKPLAIFIDNGFALEEMYQNVRNATDILGADLIVYKTAAMLRMFPKLIKSGRRLYYCRICHALLDMAVLSICHKYNIGLALGGYTKGQQYLRNNELFWIYDESDRNICELLKDDPEFGHLLPLYQNQHAYFEEHFGRIQQISPFKYVEWNEDEILKLITEELKWQKPQRSWPDKSSNCAFNYVAQYLAEKQFGYAQHESELSVQVRSKELTRERAEQIIESPIEESDLVNALQKLGLTLDDIL